VGPSCFQIANDSRGLTSGVSMASVDRTSATVVISYSKTVLCPLPGQLWAEWGKGKDNVSYQSLDRVAAAECSGHDGWRLGHGEAACDRRGSQHRQVEVPLTHPCGALDPEACGQLGLGAGDRVDPAAERARGELSESGGHEA
jgi:hypothetical protein